MQIIQYSAGAIKMKKQILILLTILTGLTQGLLGQDTLPDFSLKNAGNNRIIIGWNNNFKEIKQISIQRSFDSLTGYKTILTVPDPTTPQNGYVDAKAVNDHMFYRLYIMLDKGIFLFSNPKKPVRDTFSVLARTEARDTIQMGDSFIVAKPFNVNLDKFPATDSVAVPNRNNMPRPVSFVPSSYVFTGRDGYVRINLPENEFLSRYSIKFFEDDGTYLFELKNMTQHDFKLDKANFFHAGWFRFELYDNGKVMEKHKFYLPKDF
jgi:hypothetical protein